MTVNRASPIPVELIPPLEFTVPGPPVPKARARVANGHGFTPERTSEYEEAVCYAALYALLQYLKRNSMAWPGIAKSYRLSCDFYRRANRGDLSNFIKSVEDALNMTRRYGQPVWPDDRLVTSYGQMAMYVDRTSPRTVVRVEVVKL